MGVVEFEAMVADQLGEVATVDTPGDVVAGRDRQERAGVVDESGRVGEAGGLGDRPAVAQHSFDAVEEPPRRAEAHGRVVPGQRGEFAAERRLVEGEHDEPEARVVAEPVEQRSEAVDVVDRSRDVGSHVATEAFEERAVVIAPGPGMELHHEPVLDAHRCHLHEDLTAKELLAVLVERPGQRTGEQRGAACRSSDAVNAVGGP